MNAIENVIEFFLNNKNSSQDEKQNQNEDYSQENQTVDTQKNDPRIKTLFSAIKVGDELIIPDKAFRTEFRRIRVYSGDKIYDSGDVSLKCNDHIYIVKRNKNYITFTHFVVISLEKENNCKSIYVRRMLDQENIENSFISENYIKFILKARDEFYN